MNTKKKRVFSMAVCILFLFVTFASLFYIVKEENHNCTGEDCPVCANIHQAEQALKKWSTDMVAHVSVNPMLLVLVMMMAGQALFVAGTSPVSQKVRLNN